MKPRTWMQCIKQRDSISNAYNLWEGGFHMCSRGCFWWTSAKAMCHISYSKCTSPLSNDARRLSRRTPKMSSPARCGHHDALKRARPHRYDVSGCAACIGGKPASSAVDQRFTRMSRVSSSGLCGGLEGNPRAVELAVLST